MKENRIKIVINKPVGEVFEFTTNPKNTHLWIPSITEEVCDEYPPRIGTVYKNHGDDSDWHTYKVTELEPSKTFTLTDEKGNYSVRYTYMKIDDNTTEMEYYEWVRERELDNPFTGDIFLLLKRVMENPD